MSRALLIAVSVALVAAGLWLAQHRVAGRVDSAGPIRPGARARAVDAGPGVAAVGMTASRDERAVAESAPTAPADAAAREDETDPRFVLEGRVVDPGGLGVPGQRLRLHRDGRPSLERVVDEQGAFRFEGLEPGRVTLELDPTRLPPGLLAPFDPRATEGLVVDLPTDRPLRIELVRPARVVGRVRYADGGSAGDLAVVLTPTANRRAPDLVTRTGPDGAFELWDAQGMAYELALEHRLDYEGPLALPPRRRVDVPAAGLLDLGELVIGGGGGALLGRLVDAGGAPRDGLEVHVHYGKEVGAYDTREPAAAVRTDADGRWRVEGLAPGEVTVRPAVGRRSLAAQPFTVHVGPGGRTVIPDQVLE